MIYVRLSPRPLVWPTSSPAPLLDSESLDRIMASQSEREAFTICAMVDGELRRYGNRWARPGGRAWNAAQARVISDVVGLELDLWEIGAQIEEAQFGYC